MGDNEYNQILARAHAAIKEIPNETQRLVLTHFIMEISYLFNREIAILENASNWITAGAMNPAALEQLNGIRATLRFELSKSISAYRFLVVDRVNDNRFKTQIQQLWNYICRWHKENRQPSLDVDL